MKKGYFREVVNVSELLTHSLDLLKAGIHTHAKANQKELCRDHNRVINTYDRVLTDAPRTHFVFSEFTSA